MPNSRKSIRLDIDIPNYDIAVAQIRGMILNLRELEKAATDAAFAIARAVDVQQKIEAGKKRKGARRG